MTQCHDNSCIVTLCSDAKRNLRQFNPDKIGAVPFRNGHSHRPLLLHSTSFQESEEPSKRSQFVSSRNHGSFDDALLSPQSPADYLKSLQELDEIGVGALPRHLRTSYKRKLKVEQIIRDMGLEDSIDELPPVENLPPAPPVPPVQSSSKYPVPPPGVLSPIEEHPTLSEEDDYPSQIILHKMQSVSDVCAWVCVCVYVCVCVCVCGGVWVYVCLHVYACMLACMYMCLSHAHTSWPYTTPHSAIFMSGVCVVHQQHPHH